MNLRQLPLIPTIVVLFAAGIMVWLGFWQLGRADEKAALIAKYSTIAPSAPSVPMIAGSGESTWETEYLYRKVNFFCPPPASMRSTAGTSQTGVKGWAHVAQCIVPDTDVVEVALGWSRDPNSPAWEGGVVEGVMGPNKKVVADPALAGLQPLAKPDPRDLPNNHLAYAGQWFFFALTALVIYFLAIRKKLTERRED